MAIVLIVSKLEIASPFSWTSIIGRMRTQTDRETDMRVRLKHYPSISKLAPPYCPGFAVFPFSASIATGTPRKCFHKKIVFIATDE